MHSVFACLTCSESLLVPSVHYMFRKSACKGAVEQAQGTGNHLTWTRSAVWHKHMAPPLQVKQRFTNTQQLIARVGSVHTFCIAKCSFQVAR